MSLNGNQVLRRSARTGLLLHRQLDTSRSSFTSSAGAPTSNAPLMADKVIWLWQTGQQMGMEKNRKRKHSLLWPSIQEPGQLFSLDVKRKQAATLWESYKKKEKSNPLLVRVAGKRRNVRGRMTDGCVMVRERKSQHRRGVKRSNRPQRSYRGNSRVI